MVADKPLKPTTKQIEAENPLAEIRRNYKAGTLQADGDVGVLSGVSGSHQL